MQLASLSPDIQVWLKFEPTPALLLAVIQQELAILQQKDSDDGSQKLKWAL